MSRSFLFLLASVVFCLATGLSVFAQSEPDADADQHRWTTSRIQGTPDPPSPYTIRQVFANVELQHPTELIWCGAAERWIAVQQNCKLLSFSEGASSELLLNLKLVHDTAFRAYGIAFHPQFPTEPWCYIAYSTKPKDVQGSRLSRFRATLDDGLVIHGDTETPLLKWDSNGHSGGSVHFGPEDGYLYLSIGDGQSPNPPDVNNTGQDMTDLEASILRIDVDRQADGKAYAIPEDNPFVDRDPIRPELWAYGLRNPWKMSFDSKSQTLWTGDVGWEMREMVYQIKRGGNYGWSIKEGSQDVKPNEQPVIPITPPVVEHDHIEARSVTGGYFYHGSEFDDLKDAYIYGDWMTGKIWALKHDGQSVTWHREIADTSLQIICFAAAPDGNVLVVGYDGTIHELIPNQQPPASADFPRRLSETGLFTDVANQTAADGVMQYQINAHAWADGATAKQWVALPPGPELSTFAKSDWQIGAVEGFVNFPHDTVLAKTISFQMDQDDPASMRKLETQILHRYHDDWQAYNYVWNAEQTDAVLQDNQASDEKLTIRDSKVPGGFRTQTWHHASRDECLLCHIWSAGTAHGFKPEQLNMPLDEENQLDRFTRMGWFKERPPTGEPTVDPSDVTAELESRARSYLDLNCAHCHRRNGGGTAAFELLAGIERDKMEVIDAIPTQGDFGIANAKVIASGNPGQSVLLYRLAKSGRGRMPQFGCNVIDEQGIQLIHDWIAALGSDDPNTIDLSQCPDNAAELAAMLQTHLESPAKALALSVAVGRDGVTTDTRDRIVQVAARHADSRISQLFERFQPEEQRVRRLGDTIDAKALLAISGDAVRGEKWFSHAADSSCRQCHSIDVNDKTFRAGPSLVGIAKKQTREQILASIIDPSAVIDEKFRATNVLTVDGQVMTGIVESGNDHTLVLVDPQGKRQEISTDDIEEQLVAKKSLMPERLLSGMTEQQAADLIAFLSTLK